MRPARNQPMCEACWIESQGVTAAQFGVDHGEDGWPAGLFLPMVRRPVLIDPGQHLYQCAWCGKPTFVGCWVRVEREAAERLLFTHVEDTG